MPLHPTGALLTISTPNFDRLVEFYQHLLDQEPVALLPNVYAEFHLPGVKLGIFRPKSEEETESRPREEEARTGRKREEARTGVRHPNSTHLHSVPPSHTPTPSGMSLCIEVGNLENAIAHITQQGFPPAEPIITASHGREVYAYDPDGNWLILHQSHSSDRTQLTEISK